MNIKTLFVIGLLSISVSSVADDKIIAQAYELYLNNFRVPATTNGSAAFKECGDCDRMLVRVTANTRYVINGKAVRLEDFRKTLMALNDRDEVPVIVLHHLESDTVQSVTVSL